MTRSDGGEKEPSGTRTLQHPVHIGVPAEHPCNCGGGQLPNLEHPPTFPNPNMPPPVRGRAEDQASDLPEMMTACCSCDRRMSSPCLAIITKTYKNR